MRFRAVHDEQHGQQHGERRFDHAHSNTFVWRHLHKDRFKFRRGVPLPRYVRIRYGTSTKVK